MARAERKRIGELFVDAGVITEKQLEEALAKQRSTGQRLGRVLIGMGHVTPEQKVDVLKSQLGLESVDLSHRVLDPDVVKLIPEALCRKYVVFPVERRENRLTVAMEDPLDIFAIDDLRSRTGLGIDPLVASEDDIVTTMDQYFDTKSSVDDIIKDFKPLDVESDDSALGVSGEVLEEGPVIKFVNLILEQAVRDRASDVHIEPSEKDFRVRYRIDGVLRDAASSSRSMHAAIVSRIKIMANLDISEKRLPQDGRVRIAAEGREIDLRVSTLPTIYGEKVVMRLLDKTRVLVKLGQLGFPYVALARYQAIMKQHHGMVLVTGPTGSGKTTTLYATLNELNTPEKNILTVEDPVEYRLAGINQVQVNARMGMDFARALRAFLRQDPDIIMVGEIRDRETAMIAVESALTGHMVLSTLHTNDAASTIVRLLDMGVEAFQVASAISVIVAQRLVRMVCPHCKYSFELNSEAVEGYDPAFALELTALMPATLAKGKGCRHCSNTGYQGRMGVYELMVLTPKLRELITSGASVDRLREEAIRSGMKTLKEDGVAKILAGVTTIDEVVRAVFAQDMV